MSGLKIFRFGSVTDGAASLKDDLGGKGANLAEMSSIGLPVPPGFTIPCSLSVEYGKASAQEKHVLEGSLWGLLSDGIDYLKDQFGYTPLVSVRSGARVSMPGMMDTILNVGITTDTLPMWKTMLGDRVALDSYRRFLQMYGSVVYGLPMSEFEDALQVVKSTFGVKGDSELSVAALNELVNAYLIVYAASGKSVPDTFAEQIQNSVLAVFKSWDNPRAVEYRKIHNIPYEWGTAVNIQAMVFGNAGEDSCTGVLFSRDPSDGSNYVVGEFLINAQGEDVVAGIRTPLPLALMESWNESVFNELLELVGVLESHYEDMQDVEFTVQSGKLWILQTRSGKRTPLAAFQIAHALVHEGVITKEVAVSRVSRKQLLQALSDIVDPTYKVAPHLVGIAAGGGVVSGVAVLSAEAALNCKQPCILVTQETNPDDIAGMNAAVGILTATGGLTSHAAVVARGMGKSAVVGATGLGVSETTFGVLLNGQHTVFLPGTQITLDGSTGNVWIGQTVPVVSASNNPAIRELVMWAAADDMIERVTFPLSYGPDEIEKKVARLSGVVHIDTATFDSRDLKQKMAALGAGLAESKVTLVYVDVKPITDIFSSADLVIERMFGGAIDRAAVIRLKLHEMRFWGKSVLSSVVVCGTTYTEAESSLIFLVNKGAKVLGTVLSFADLLNADGPLTIEDDVITRVFGNADAYAKAKAMVEASTGKKLSGIGVRPAYWYEFLPEGK